PCGLGTCRHSRESRKQAGLPGLGASGTINSQRTKMNFIADWTHSLSPSAILDVRASFGRFTAYFPDADVASGLTAKDLGITGAAHAPTSTTDFPPRIVVDQFSNLFGNGSNLYTWSTDNQWNIVPTVTISRGAKTLKS